MNYLIGICSITSSLVIGKLYNDNQKSKDNLKKSNALNNALFNEYFEPITCTSPYCHCRTVDKPYPFMCYQWDERQCFDPPNHIKQPPQFKNN